MNEQMIRKNNMKIFPIYKMFAWDLLFYYAIIFLFLTQEKGFSASQVLLADFFYTLSHIIFQIFCINIIDILGKQKSMLLGNLLIATSILLLILGNNFTLLAIAHLVMSLGFSIKSPCEPTILSDSIPKSSYSSNIFSKLDSKGNTFYYILDAISSATTGFLYVINPYIPMIICFICYLISTIICLNFHDIPSQKSAKHSSLRTYYIDISITFKQILKSNRLKCLLICSALIFPLLMIFGTLRSSILVDIGLPEQYFGIVVAIMQILSSLSSRNQHWFHKKLKNKFLSYCAMCITISFILIGLIVLCNISYIVSIIACLLGIFTIGIIKGPYFTLMSKYLNSFSNSNVNTKIFAVKSLLDNFIRMILSLLTSLLLSITTTSYAFIIIGCIFFVIFIFLLDYMKTKVGLKPEEYPKEDLVFSDKK